MTIFFDENFPPDFAVGFNYFLSSHGPFVSLNLETASTVSAFGRGKSDESIIPEIGKQGGYLISQDFNMYKKIINIPYLNNMKLVHFSSGMKARRNKAITGLSL